MHQSEDPNLKAMVASCYLDDSGIEDAAQVTVLAGCVLGKDAFLKLSDKWAALLHRFRIESLHMTDFVRPHGKHCSMFPEMKMALFSEVVKIINRQKTYSICASLKNREFREVCSREFGVAPPLSPYSIAFIGVAIRNTRLARDNDWPSHMSYLIDQGNSQASELQLGHSIITGIEKYHRLPFTGSLTFADDARNYALQAADIVAWSSRRRLSGDGLYGEFAPLKKLFEQRFSPDGVSINPHIDYEVTTEMTRRLVRSTFVFSPKADKSTMEQYRKILTGENDGNGKL
ncbi:MAG: DUF3800 domain-containing protein [Acidobacteriota bacterium]